MGTHNLTREDLERLLLKADPGEIVMPTAVEEWKQESLTEGLVQGRAETLLRQLERCFGAALEDARTRVLAASVGDLDAFVSASSLDDVFRNGAKNLYPQPDRRQVERKTLRRFDAGTCSEVAFAC